MPKATFTSFASLDNSLFHLAYLFPAGQVPLTANTWAMSDPNGTSTQKYTLKTELTKPGSGHADPIMDIKVQFQGSFSEGASGWSGAVNRIKLVQDGDTTGIIKLGGNLDLGDVYGQTSSGFIWLQMALDGFKATLDRGNDEFAGSEGKDVIKGAGGHDRLTGGPGNDSLFGGAGHDVLQGSQGDDKLFGGRGNDRLDGDSGADKMFGGKGRDYFAATNSGDVIRGGGGKDKIEISTAFAFQNGAVVKDFKKGAGDKISLENLLEFQFGTFDEIRYVRDADFSGDADVVEVRMEGGLVEVDANNDGVHDYAITLEGEDSFGGSNWLILPDGLDFV